MSKLCLVALVCFLAVSCAAGSPPGETSNAPAGDPKPEDSASDPERADFMRQCAKSREREAFCSCSFDAAKRTLTPEELGKAELEPERAELLRRAIASECTDKLPEQAVKEGFMVGCTSEGASLGPFCDCTWTALRKSASVSEIARMSASGRDPRVTQASRSCMSKFPSKELDEAMRVTFLKGCMRRSGAEKFCACAWTTFRKEVTPVEMVLEGEKSGKARAAFAKIKETCEKLAPKRAN